MARVTGIGGVFFKAGNNNKELASWYEKHLGVVLKDFGGAVLNWQEDMEEMITQLKNGDVDIFKGPESHENGKFAWLLDPDGNKIELWEPKNWNEKNKT